MCFLFYLVYFSGPSLNPGFANISACLPEKCLLLSQDSGGPRSPIAPGPRMFCCIRLVAPYRAIPRDYCARVFGVPTWPIGCDTPSSSPERFPLGEHAKWRCDTPPTKGYLSDTCAIPHENKANGCEYPPSAILSRKGMRDMGGRISHWAAKCIRFGNSLLKFNVAALVPPRMERPLPVHTSRDHLRSEKTYKVRQEKRVGSGDRPVG